MQSSFHDRSCVNRVDCNNSLAEMNHRKLANFYQKTFSPHFQLLSLAMPPRLKSAPVLPEQSVTLVPSTLLLQIHIPKLYENEFKKTVNVVKKSIV